MSEKITLPLSIVLAGLLIAGGIYLNGRITKGNPTPNQEKQLASQNLADSVRPVDANDHILGSTDARVLIIEYSDTECPYCKNFHTTMNSIMQAYGKDGKVAWVYRHLPLHSKSLKEAEATECAARFGGNSKFWEYINEIYKVTSGNDSLDPKELVNAATKVGLSSEAFNTCLDSGEMTAKVQADIKNAREIGFDATPYSVLVDTKKNTYDTIPGALPYGLIKSSIDSILSS